MIKKKKGYHRKKNKDIQKTNKLIFKNHDIQKTINAVFQLSLENTPLNKILEKTLDLLSSISWLSFKSGSIFVYDDSKKYFEMIAQRGISSEIRNKYSRIKKGFFVGKPELGKNLASLSSKKEKDHIFSQKTKFQKTYSLPIAFRNKILGILHINTKEELTGGKIKDQLLLAISDALAKVIQNKKSEENLSKINRARLVLTKSNHALVHAKNEAELLNNVCKILVDSGEYNLAWVGTPANNQEKTIKILAKVGDTDYLKKIKLSWSKDTPLGNGPAEKTIRTRTPQIAKNILENPSFIPWTNFAKKKGFKSTASLPLHSNGKFFGILAIYTKEINSFDKEELALLEELANDLAFGIYTLRLKNEKRNSEIRLRSSNKLLQSAFSNTHFLMAYLDKDFNYKKVNTAYAQTNGFSENYFVGKNLFELFPNDEMKEIFAKVRDTGQRYVAYEKPYLEKSGETTFWDWTIEPIKGVTGKTEGFLFTLINITNRVQSEQKLIESYKHMGSINRQISILLEMGNQSKNSRESELIEYIINSAQSLSRAKFVAIYKYYKKNDVLSCLNANLKNQKICSLEITKKPINTYDLVHKKIRTQGILSTEEKKMAGINFTYYVLKPINTPKGFWGALMLGFGSTRNIITSQELDFYQVFVIQAGLALERIKCSGNVCYLNDKNQKKKIS